MPAVIPIIGAAATIGGAALASGATKSAANTQAASQQAALDQQQAQFNQTQANQAPWLAAGRDALSQQMNLLGIGGTAGTPGTYSGGGYNAQTGQWTPGTMSAATPGISASDAQQQAITQLQQSPMYQSLYRNGQNAVLNNAAATGGLRGGNTQNSLANFGSDTLANVIQQQLANLGGISNTGNTTASNLGNQAQANSNAQSNLQSQIGSTQAGGILGQAGIWNNAFNSLGKQIGTLPTGTFGLTNPNTSLVANAGNTIAANPSIF